MLAIMALATWLVAGLQGLNLLLIWLKGDGARRGRSHIRPPVLFSHVGFAVGGLVLLVAYLAGGRPHWLAWTTAAVTLTASLLGAVMMLPYWWRRRQAMRARAAALVAAGNATPPESSGPVDVVPVERRFSYRVVLVHGFTADLTLALILLTALGVG